MSYSKIKLYVGIFVIAVFISVGAFLYILLEEKGTFEKRYNFNFNTESAASFSVGMPLKFSGFKIGQIDNISLKDDGTVHIIFSVSQANRKWISENTVLVLNKPLIGSPHIEVYSTIDNQPLPPDSTVQIMLSDDINDMINKLEPAVNKTIHIIDNIDKITTTIASPDSDLSKSLKNLERFSYKLAHNDSLLTSVTGDKNSTQTLINSIGQINAILHDLSIITKSLNNDIVQPSSSSIKDLDAILKDVKHKLETLDPVVNEIGEYKNELDSIKDQVSAGVQKSNQLLDKVDSMIGGDKQQKVKLP